MESRLVVDCNHNYQGHPVREIANGRAVGSGPKGDERKKERSGQSVFFRGKRRGKGSKSNAVLRRDLG